MSRIKELGETQRARGLRILGSRNIEAYRVEDSTNFLLKHCKDERYKKYLPLIKKYAISFASARVPTSDLMGVGLMALEEAMQSYRKTSRMGFGNYAKMIIIHRMWRYRNKNYTIFSTPCNLPSGKKISEISEYTEVSLDGWRDSCGELAADYIDIDTMFALGKRTLWALDNSLCLLSPEAREAVRLRFGLNGRVPATYSEINIILGITNSERFIRLALERMRRRLEKFGIKKEDIS